MSFNYVFSGATKLYGETTLHQICSPSGELGGWIEKESNLAQEGKCFVEDEAIVMGDVVVSGNAVISGQAVVSGSVEIKGNAIVKDLAIVNASGIIGDESIIEGEALIAGAVTISGQTIVKDNAEVRNAKLDNAVVINESIVRYSTLKNALIYKKSMVINGAKITKAARIRDGIIDGAEINDKVIISHGEHIKDSGDYAFIDIGWGKEITITKKGINWGNFHRAFGDWNSPEYKAYIAQAIANKKVKGYDLNRRQLLRKFLNPADLELFPQVIQEDKARLVLDYIFRHTTVELLSEEERREVAEQLGYSKSEFGMTSQASRNAFANKAMAEKTTEQMRDALLHVINQRDVDE